MFGSGCVDTKKKYLCCVVKPASWSEGNSDRRAICKQLARTYPAVATAMIIQANGHALERRGDVFDMSIAPERCCCEVEAEIDGEAEVEVEVGWCR